jgi:hypothetical protein
MKLGERFLRIFSRGDIYRSDPIRKRYESRACENSARKISELSTDRYETMTLATILTPSLHCGSSKTVSKYLVSASISVNEIYDASESYCNRYIDCGYASYGAEYRKRPCDGARTFRARVVSNL